MIIKIGKYFLCGEKEQELPAGYSRSTQRLIQVGQFLRAKKSKPFNRGNRITRISFTVTREHASYQAAVEWDTEHENNIPDDGDLTINSGRSTKILLDGQLEECSCDPIIGCTTIHHYRLVAGGV